MQRDLSLEFLRVVEKAALAAAHTMGYGDRHAADDAAVKAMRAELSGVAIRGRIVIGEGERDEAPMLYIGEEVGNGAAGAPGIDIAVDPLEGTNLCATGSPNAIAVIAASEPGGLLHAPDIYMEKLAVGPSCKGAVELDSPAKDNLNAIAKRLDRDVEDLFIVVLDRPRHDRPDRATGQDGHKRPETNLLDPRPRPRQEHRLRLHGGDQRRPAARRALLRRGRPHALAGDDPRAPQRALRRRRPPRAAGRRQGAVQVAPLWNFLTPRLVGRHRGRKSMQRARQLKPFAGAQGERGGALQVVLIVLGAIVLIVALVVLAAVVMVNRFVKVEVNRGEEGKRVAGHTPFGEFVAEKSEDAAKKLKLPVYPGAEPEEEAG